MMHIQSLTTLLGLGGAKEQATPDTAKNDTFSQLLGLLPGAGKAEAQVSGLGAAHGAEGLPTPLQPGQARALHSELAGALLPPQAGDPAGGVAPAAGKNAALVESLFALQTGKSAPQTGNTSAATGKTLPVNQTPIQVANMPPSIGSLEALLGEQTGQSVPGDATKPDGHDAQNLSERAQLTFSDLPLLHGFAGLNMVPPDPAASAASSRASAPATSPADQSMVAASQFVQTIVQAPARNAKQRAAATGTDSASQAATAPAAAGAPQAQFSVPLGQPVPARSAALARNGLSGASPVPASMSAAQPSQPSLSVSEPTEANAPAAPNQQPQSPQVELAAVIDRLVMTRMEAREGRSEVNVPHPDFGRVTLSLSLAEQDRLGLAMPDAPVELRVAVGQAFAPASRSEPSSTTATDSSAAGLLDTRGQEQRRDTNQGSPAQPQRGAAGNPLTTGRDGHSDNPPAQRRSASGRGILA